MSNKEDKSPLIWDAEKSNPDLTEKIKSRLREVKDPEIGMDIVQLGLVRNIEIKDDAVQMVMILTTPYCPYGPMMMESARKKVEEETGKKTEIRYGTEVWDRTMMEEESGFDWGLF